MSDSDLLAAAVDMARRAGDLLLELFARGVEVERKGEVDLVTRADRASEELIVGEIRRRFPDHDVLAEERGGGSQGEGRPLWIVDPLDGTTNFAHGVPLWSVSIAVQRAGEIVAGVVHDPSRDECFTASFGGGAFRNGERIRVSPATALSDALLVTGFPYDIRTSQVDNLDHFARFMKRARAVRRLGSAALDLSWVACGRFDGFWEPKLHPWDVAAGTLLVREAGGQVTCFDGSRFDVFSDEIVAAPPALMPALREVLALGRRSGDASGAQPAGGRLAGDGTLC
ncbi:MAG: inositol monophosphatase family protein [bacterium]